MENIIIRLGKLVHSTEPIPYTQPNSDAPTMRHAYGWSPDMTPVEAWLSAQGWWRLRADRAIKAHLAIVVNQNWTVVAVAHVDGVVKGEDRSWLLGRVDTTGTYDPWLGKQVKPNNSRNPITYANTRDFVNPEQVTDGTVCID